MDWQPELFETPSRGAGRVIVLEAAPGRARRGLLRRWLEGSRSEGGAAWLLSCDRRAEGPWAGLDELFGKLVPVMRLGAPELIRQHDYELAIILPALQRTLAVRNPNLTDLSSPAERTRNYPADRAFRIVHGLIDLLADWQQHAGERRCSIACDHFGDAGSLVRLFFTELVRRRGERLGLSLLVAADPGTGEEVASHFGGGAVRRRVRLELPSGPSPRSSGEEMSRAAQELVRRVGGDPIARQIHLPRIIQRWLLSDRPWEALPHQIEELDLLIARGLYEDGREYGEAALALLERYDPQGVSRRLTIYLKLHYCYVGLKRPLQALRVIEKALPMVDRPEDTAQWRYLLAMLYARHLPRRDLARAEAELDLGLEEVLRAGLPPEQKAFLASFNRNGLALIRHFQGRSAEAIALCRWGYEQLDAHLDPVQHRLHRSVLVYNMAQVHAATGRTEQAIRHLTEAMAMDPNYSEYFNERGALYLKLERYEESLSDFLTAIELSPPYMEVWVNLGQCYRLMGRLEDAVAAYSRALDLAPGQLLALVGRAQAFDGLGQAGAALADYDAALELEPAQPLVLANRAVLHYDAGRLSEALEDLDRAIGCAPGMPELYENRAVVLRALGRPEAARQGAAPG